ncbi:MAG: hypothetical protein ACI854_002785, partial [Arenicella sp.]
LAGITKKIHSGLNRLLSVRHKIFFAQTIKASFSYNSFKPKIKNPPTSNNDEGYL